MTAPRPARINPPSPENTVFINYLFSGGKSGFPNAQGEMVETIMSRVPLLGEEFEFPTLVSNKSVAAIQSMTDATFRSLFAILEPTISKSLIITKSDLEHRSVVEFDRQVQAYERDDTGLGPFTLGQVQAYVLYDCTLTNYPNWTKLSGLYNQSTEDQQEAIHQYFLNFHGVSLEDLMATTGPSLKIHESSRPPRSKHGEGDLYLFNEDTQKWVREDAAYSQYMIYLKSDKDQKTDTDAKLILMGGATSIEQAAAKATAIAKDYAALGPLNQFQTIDISYRSVTIIEAKILEIGASRIHELMPVKLQWNVDRLDEYKASLEKTKRGFLDNSTGELDERSAMYVAKLSKIIESLPKLSPEAMKMSILEAERAQGVQWAKVYKLEDDLGL